MRDTFFVAHRQALCEMELESIEDLDEETQMNVIHLTEINLICMTTSEERTAEALDQYIQTNSYSPG